VPSGNDSHYRRFPEPGRQDSAWAPKGGRRHRNEGSKKAVRKIYPKAIAEAEKAVALAPEDAEAHALLGDLYGRSTQVRMDEGDFMAGMTYGPKAEKELQKALALDPRCPRAHLAQGRSLLFKPEFVGGSPKKALASFETATDLDPASDEAQYWLGMAYAKLARPEERPGPPSERRWDSTRSRRRH
jgi:tetratricopeptide (TPR) repeat protein